MKWKNSYVEVKSKVIIARISKRRQIWSFIYFANILVGGLTNATGKAAGVLWYINKEQHTFSQKQNNITSEIQICSSMSRSLFF